MEWQLSVPPHVGDDSRSRQQISPSSEAEPMPFTTKAVSAVLLHIFLGFLDLPGNSGYQIKISTISPLVTQGSQAISSVENE